VSSSCFPNLATSRNDSRSLQIQPADSKWTKIVGRKTGESTNDLFKAPIRINEASRIALTRLAIGLEARFQVLDFVVWTKHNIMFG
jgi:hypothetical protein